MGITLTTKTASYGVLAGIPATDVSTLCVAINPAYYDAMTGLSPAVAAGQFLIVKVAVQNAVGAAVRTLRLIKPDGTLMLQFPAANQPALPTDSTVIYSSRVIIGNPADWVNLKLQASVGAAGDIVKIIAGSLVFAFAESCNITDESLIKRNVNNVYFMSMQTTQEALLGKVGSPTASAFLPVPVNGLNSGFVWSTNSGMTLYSWDGASIGIAP